MRGVLVIAIAVTALSACEETAEQAYRRKVSELDPSAGLAKNDQLLGDISRYWWSKRGISIDGYVFLQDGFGSLPLDPKDRVLVDKLHVLLDQASSENTTKAKVITEHIAQILGLVRAPGHDEHLFRCARDSVSSSACITALQHIADPTTLDAMVPLMDLPAVNDDAAPKSGGTPHRFANALAELRMRGIPYLQKAVERGTPGCGRALAALEHLIDPMYGAPVPEDQVLKRRALDAVKQGLTNERFLCRGYAGSIILRNDPASRSLVEPLRNDPLPAVRDVIAAQLDGRPVPDSADYDDKGMPKPPKPNK